MVQIPDSLRCLFTAEIRLLVGLTAPAMGFETAIRWMGVVVGMGGGVTGVLCVLVASQASTNSFAPIAG